VQHPTGEKAKYRGIYVPGCRCVAEVLIRTGTCFPPCPECGRDVNWYFSRSVWSEWPVPPPQVHRGDGE
jgi:hypothetical protein